MPGTAVRTYTRPRDRVKILFWLCSARSPGRTSLYPLAARARRRDPDAPVRKDDALLRGRVIVAAYDEESVIERRIANLQALDYPARSSSSSSPRTPRPTARRSSLRRPARA